MKNTREDYMTTAITLTAKYGIENVSVRRLANSMKMTEAALYRHYSGRDELLEKTFLATDSKLSDIFMQNFFVHGFSGEPFEEVIHQVWKVLYQYLLDHPEEALFLVRYRYSSLYIDEVRSMRKAYDGTFDKIYETFEANLGSHTQTYRGFLISNIFEVTLSFAEKVATGRMVADENLENMLWSFIKAEIAVLLAPSDTRPEE